MQGIQFVLSLSCSSTISETYLLYLEKLILLFAHFADRPAGGILHQLRLTPAKTRVATATAPKTVRRKERKAMAALWGIFTLHSCRAVKNISHPQQINHFRASCEGLHSYPNICWVCARARAIYYVIKWHTICSCQIRLESHMSGSRISAAPAICVQNAKCLRQSL